MWHVEVWRNLVREGTVVCGTWKCGGIWLVARTVSDISEDVSVRNVLMHFAH